MKIIKIGAVWCPECRIMRPRWKQLEQEMPWLDTEMKDYDADKDIVAKYRPKQIPAFICLDKNGQEIDRIYGEISIERLRKWAEKYKNR